MRLEIDGGVKVDNIGEIARAGADTFVAGSAIFGSKDYAATIKAMRKEIAAERIGSAAGARRRHKSPRSAGFVAARRYGVHRPRRLRRRNRRRHHRRHRRPSTALTRRRPPRRAGRGGLGGHDDRPGLHLRPRVEHDDGLAGGAQQTLLFEHLEHAAGHFARAADQARQLLAADLDLHAFGMRHRIRLAAQIHDGVGDAARDVDEREVAELAVGAIEARGELRGQLEDRPGLSAAICRKRG